MESKQTTIIVIVLVALLALAYWSFSMQGVDAPNTNETATTTEQSVTGTAESIAQNTALVPAGLAASLSIVSDKATYAVGDEVALSFYLETPVAIGGTDVIFSFDATKLELVKGLAKGNFTQEVSQLATANVTQSGGGALTVNYTNNKKEGDSVVYTFSALAQPGEEVIGKTKLGTIVLRAKKAGNTPVSILFEKEGVSTDSNIAYQGRDILKSVVGTTVRVQTTP